MKASPEVTSMSPDISEDYDWDNPRNANSPVSILNVVVFPAPLTPGNVLTQFEKL